MSIRKSLDQIEKEMFNPGVMPFETNCQSIVLAQKEYIMSSPNADYCLDGIWQMCEEGNEKERINLPWLDSVEAYVPGSVHSALMLNGIIPDPMVGKNDEYAREKSFRTWWLRKEFQNLESNKKLKLVFDGVCDQCSVWLNGTYLGEHKGMFGGPEFEISHLLQENNVLIIKINPAPLIISEGYPNPYWTGLNIGFMHTVVFNCVYGWHYADLPALGIWRSVRIVELPEIEIRNTFIALQDYKEGVVDFYTELYSDISQVKGKIMLCIEPDNFERKPYSFEMDMYAGKNKTDVHYRFILPDFKLWWPVGMGEPYLYKINVQFVLDDGSILDSKTRIFGLRTIEMKPLPGGAYNDKYNWTFLINGEPMFIKGANWCTMDALMRFTSERYERFLELAKRQHIQLLRAWGGGLVETDEFYDLCNRKGIMVFQEWPIAWDSHNTQPESVLEETIVKNILRLRNNPSLIMWGGGNESEDPSGDIMKMVGRLCYELDGTRPFHISEPWGGSTHNYEVYWRKQPLDYNLSLTGSFIGEFGLASSPNVESVERYLVSENKDMWPPSDESVFAYHTPKFNTLNDMEIITQYVSDFVKNDSMENFIFGSQLAQATGMRHTLELARTRWPESTGICYYKLNDVYPACSWSTIDWYGVPKMSYYVFQDCYQPLHACIILPKLNFSGEAISLPVYIMDDNGNLDKNSWKVKVKAYNSNLEMVKESVYQVEASIEKMKNIGSFDLCKSQTSSTPLFFLVQVIVEGEVKDSTFYWANYAYKQGCLLNLPQTELKLSFKADKMIVTNMGKKPAVAVNFDCSKVSDTAFLEDNYFWLDSGETRTINTNTLSISGVKAWNAGLKAD